MLLFKSGDWLDSEKQIELTDSICDFIQDKFPQIKGNTIEGVLSDGSTLTSCAVDLSLAKPARIWRPLQVASHATYNPVVCLVLVITQL